MLDSIYHRKIVFLARKKSELKKISTLATVAAQPSTSIKHQPMDTSFMPGLSLSLSPDTLSFN